MDQIRSLIKDLDWSNSETVTRNAMQQLLEVNEEEAVLLAEQSSDLCCKECWHNAAIILREIGYPRNRLALPYMMRWFQDVNWPGVQTIIEALKRIDQDILIPHLQYAIKEIIFEKDETWAYGIIHLAEELNIPFSLVCEQNIQKKLYTIAHITL